MNKSDSMLKKALICGSATAVLVAIYSNKASGQTISATFRSVNPGLITSGTFANRAYESENAGVLNFDEFSAFCADPFQSINYNERVTYQQTSVSALTGASVISKLLGGYMASARTSVDAAAVQWLIWEVLIDGSSNLSLTAGNARLSSSGTSGQVLAKANTYIAGLSGFSSYNFQYLTNASRQDMIRFTGVSQDSVTSAVPEPSTTVLTFVAGLALWRRRR